MPHARLTGIIARLLLAASLSAGLVRVAEAAAQSPAGKPAATDTLITELVKAKERPKADTATYDQAIVILIASDDLPAAMQLEIVDGLVQKVPNSGIADSLNVLRQFQSRLKKWIFDHQGEAKPVELTFPAESAAAWTTGCRSLAWGPIPGWSNEAVSISFGEGDARRTYKRELCATEQFASLCAADDAGWPGTSPPPFQLMPGKKAVFAAMQPYPGATGISITEVLMVVDGQLVSFLRVVTAEDGADKAETKALELSLVTKLADSLKGVGAGCAVTTNAVIGDTFPVSATWSDSVGTFKARSSRPADPAQAAKLHIKSFSCDIALKTVGTMVGAKEIRDVLQDRAVSSIAEADIARLQTMDDQRLVVVSALVDCTDTDEPCFPTVVLTDLDSKKKYEELGDNRTIAIWVAQDFAPAVGGSGELFPLDMFPTRVRAARSGDEGAIAQTQGQRSFAFIVPRTTKRMSVVLKGTLGVEHAFELPAVEPTDAISGQPLFVGVTTTLKGDEAAESLASLAPAGFDQWRSWSNEAAKRADEAKQQIRSQMWAEFAKKKAEDSKKNKRALDETIR
jgi:predicted pyridoxine 5'-phosphate oxidase superfamily flavin-nucleotide-binding protein